ncbi:antichymotrypsin-2-like isoform X1 [Papilio machaon]|uniref:antichymotrypsin-2-like isoform X1 n=1 Tax=Papilio machaon TaxID=76193 RepID=UPI001E664F6A|nr:antichymotrypsin-2-like isoform X1 [Papilio machaon]XP_045542245.1 antichymotrypsin-2-like isoform X1 [Papilio machaon]XP_045542249.1 antichymotrypsin-2-like isoform X1 [Papilio machaon]
MSEKVVTSAIAQFSARFCNELDKSTSVVSSPLSAEFVLALLALGTTDPAHEELLTSLGITNDDAVRSSFSAVSSNLRSVKGVTLNVANKVYLMDGNYDLNEQLKEDAVKVFDVSFEKVDFSNGAAAAKLINKWVKSKTNEKIKGLISSKSLNSDSRLVLVNALYFKGTWKKQFDPADTLDRPFHVDKKKTVMVPMMYLEDVLIYGESQKLGAQLLRMHYVGENASMLIVLPNEINGLDGVLKKLADGYDLMAEVDNMFNTKVQVTIPKFKIETEIDLCDLLPKLGIKAIFDRNNSGLTKVLNTDEKLYVSKAVQKAFIEVNEEGAEAAAATEMMCMPLSAFFMEPPVPRFDADRPFLTVILVDDTPYFMATQRAPRSNHATLPIRRAPWTSRRSARMRARRNDPHWQ